MLFSCSSEENLVQSTQNRSVVAAKNWFESTNNNENFKILQYTKELLWDNAIVSNGDKGEVIEVPLILQENITTSANLKIKDYHRLLFIKKENNTYETKYVQVFTADSTYNNLDKKFNYYSIKDNFNGSLYVLNGMAKSGTSLKFKKGEKINPHFTAKDSDQAEIICMYVGWWYEDGSFDPIIELACFGGGGGYGSGPHGGGDGETATATLIAQAIEDQIDDSQLDECTKGVLAKLKNLANVDIATIFEKFGVPKNGTYNIRIVPGTPTDPKALAETKLDGSKNNYVITIRDTYLNGINNNNRPPTDLAIATVLVHELIHAHFMALFDDYKNNGDICALDNYDCLFMKYAANNYEGTTDPHHAQMFESYLGIMADALQEFQTGIPVDTEAVQLYQDLSMSTLAGTPIFEERYPNDYNAPNYTERQRISYRRLAENNNITTSVYVPQGKPCSN